MKKNNRYRLYRVLPTVLIALLLFISATYAQWFENGTPVCVTAGDQLSPQIASDSRGETVIAWDGEGVVVQRINAFGDILWDADGVVLMSWKYKAAYPLGRPGRWHDGDLELLARGELRGVHTAAHTVRQIALR